MIQDWFEFFLFKLKNESLNNFSLSSTIIKHCLVQLNSIQVYHLVLNNGKRLKIVQENFVDMMTIIGILHFKNYLINVLIYL